MDLAEKRGGGIYESQDVYLELCGKTGVLLKAVQNKSEISKLELFCIIYDLLLVTICDH